MGDVINEKRRAALQATSVRLRSEAQAIIDSLSDPSAKDFYRRLVVFDARLQLRLTTDLQERRRRP